MLNEKKKKKIVPKLRQEVKVDIVTSDDIKIYYTGKFQDFTSRYIINGNNQPKLHSVIFKLLTIQSPYCTRSGSSTGCVSGP